MITRRGFLGTMVAAPAAASVVFGDGHLPAWNPPPAPIESDMGLRFDAGARRSASAEYFANVVLRLVTRHLRGVPLTRLGGDEAWLGDTWGSGTFNKMPYAIIPEIRFASDSGDLILDRLEVDDLARRYAQHVRDSGLRYVGRLALPSGLQHALRVENRRLSMRFLAFYEVHTNYTVGRFDVLGTAV